MAGEDIILSVKQKIVQHTCVECVPSPGVRDQTQHVMGGQQQHRFSSLSIAMTTIHAVSVDCQQQRAQRPSYLPSICSRLVFLQRP